MDRLLTMMVAYGSAHQNRINVWMHVVGVPVIVFGVLLMAAAVQPWAVWVVVAAGLAWYVGLDGRLTAAIAPPMLAMAVAAQLMAPGVAALGAALFVGGFVFQFIGHAIEGRKPALLEGNPIVAMLTAPLFIVAELQFMAGHRLELKHAMEAGIEARQASAEPAALVG